MELAVEAMVVGEVLARMVDVRVGSKEMQKVRNFLRRTQYRLSRRLVQHTRTRSTARRDAAFSSCLESACRRTIAPKETPKMFERARVLLSGFRRVGFRQMRVSGPILDSGAMVQYYLEARRPGARDRGPGKTG